MAQDINVRVKKNGPFRGEDVAGKWTKRYFLKNRKGRAIGSKNRSGTGGFSQRHE